MKSEPTYYHTLPNGLRIVHRQLDSPVAYLGLMTGAGTRDEHPEENGIAHYIEHCVFKGTHKRTARGIITCVEGVGGEINAYTTKEETAFYAAVPLSYTARTVSLLADMFCNPAFLPKETDKELQVILDEIESYNDSPSELIYDDFENLLFSGHPLQMPVLGTKKTLRRINADTARRFMKETYRPDHTVFFSLSALPFRRVVALAERYLSDLPYTNTCLRPRTAPDATPPATRDFRRHTHQTHIMLGGRACPLGDERQPAMFLLNNILGGGSLNSRLNLALREQRGLVYTVESAYTPLSDTGLWTAYFASEPRHAKCCIELVQRELRRLCEQPLSDSALHRALRQLEGQMAVAAENRENTALTMARLTLHCGVAPAWRDTFARLSRLTPADLQAVARDFFAPDSLFTLRYL